jgi:hypothetical protein
MPTINVKTDPVVEEVFASYPDGVRSSLSSLRELILLTAIETTEIDSIEETLKWGEPSYLTRHGSTLRIDWKAKTPGQYAMYFNCTSRLVPTFKDVFSNLFQFEGNRAIVFELEDIVPEDALKECIRAALTYHKVKNLPNLGIVSTI